MLSGATGDAATPLMLGVSLILIGLVPMLRLIGVSERIAYTSCGLAIAVAMLLPWSVWESVFGQISMDFTTWVVAGLMTVIGAAWVMVYNADVILGAAGLVLSRFGTLLPVVKMAIVYPLRARFRTGATLAMFTLVVFTLVTGTASSGSFQKAFGSVEEFGGGYQVRAGTSATAPIVNMRAALRNARGIDPADFTAVGSQSVLSVKARQVGTDRAPESYVARGLDRAFLRHTTFGLGAMARGFGSADEVWRYSTPFTSSGLSGTGVFPRRSRPQVLWVGVEDASGRLSDLQQRLEDEFARAGFPKEDRGYRPHLTIARLRRPEDARELAEAHIQKKFSFIEVPVNKFALFRSQLSPKGSIYSVISEHRF